MPTPRPERPVFPDAADYVRLTVRSLERFAQDPDLANRYRVAFWADARCNRDGHAEMGPNELRQLLGKDGAEASASTVSKALRSAKDAGLIGAESTPRCLVVNHREVDQGIGRRGCKVHGIEILTGAFAA